MKIDNNIGSLYHTGLLQTQARARLQQEEARRQSNPEGAALRGNRAPDPTDGEYAQLRSRVEREQNGRVVPESLSPYVRNAVSTYDSVSRAEERDYRSKVLGVDFYA
jgi:hypothetical protein